MLKIGSNIKIIVRMSKTQQRNKTTENIEFMINIGEFRLRLSLPKHTTVGGLVSIVKGYEALHQEYGPQHMPFIGLASTHIHPVLDYWLTQSQLDFTSFKRKLELKCLYGCQRRSDRIYSGEFQFLVCLGKGAYGAVYLVRSKITGALMALKRVSKENITNYQGLMTQFRQRKNLIRMGHNNHTVNLHACFQSRNHFNFLMDYYPGGQLFLHLASSQRQKLSSSHIKHYFCEIILAMEYIHKKKVLYRDLKPENIFIDICGHLRIGDFGMSKCDFQQDDFTSSMCGSEQYMAPQIMENHQYNFSADFYSIGAILYELLTGVPPYYNQCHQVESCRLNDNFRLELIKSMALDLSKIKENTPLHQLLTNLLHPDPDYRISNFQQIKNSQWLSDIDWKSVEQKSDLMPFAPDPAAPIDFYIGRQFLQLQQQVDQINLHFQDESFTSQISQAFEYIRPESRKLLGIEQSVYNLAKPKNKGSLKEKKEKCHKKVNLSIALFEREQTACESVCSEPRVVKTDNKENVGPLRRDRSKKMIVNLGKQGSTIFLGKQTIQAQTPMTRQKTQRGAFVPITQNHSECFSRNDIDRAVRLPSQCSSKKSEQTRFVKKGISRGRETVRGQSRDQKSKGHSKEKSLKQTSLSKNVGMKRKQQKRMLPTCSFKIKLS